MEKPSVQPCFRHRGAGGFTAITCACCFLLAPSVELLLSIQIASVTSWGSLHVPCKDHRGRILHHVCYLGPSHRESGGCLSHVPEAFREFGSFSPTLSQLCFFHKPRICSVTLVVVLLNFYFEFEKCCLKTCIQLEHHLDGTGQRDLSASKKKTLRKKIIQILMCNYSVKQQNPEAQPASLQLCVLALGRSFFQGG